jgi:hypothetical protein
MKRTVTDFSTSNTSPRSQSPCGSTLQSNTGSLFRCHTRYFRAGTQLFAVWNFARVGDLCTWRWSIAMMEVASTSETSVNFYQTTRHNNPEGSHLHTRRRENLKSDLCTCWVMLESSNFANTANRYSALRIQITTPLWFEFLQLKSAMGLHGIFLRNSIILWMIMCEDIWSYSCARLKNCEESAKNAKCGIPVTRGRNHCTVTLFVFHDRVSADSSFNHHRWSI